MSFVHLHVHTHYSLLDGYSSIKKLVGRAKEYGMPAVTISDHGTMFGAVEFYRAAKAAGIKPIIGLEGYLASRRMTDKDSQYDKRSHHLLLLAENDIGYKNLLKIASASQLEGFYYHPRIDKEFLAEHSEGLIATSACLKGEVPNTILERGKENALPLLDWYFDLFGPDRFFLELQRHDMPELEQVNQDLLELGERYGARYVATNDVHYVDREDARLQDILLAIQTGAMLADPKRMRMQGDTYYLRSPGEMIELFSDLPEAITNTLEIAERCNVDLDPHGYHLPLFDVPEGETVETYLRQRCEEGLLHRYHEHAGDPAVRERLEHELGVIHEMGFDAYFLIVWDLCRYAVEKNIWYEARGSAAGSLVAYVLAITLVEPLRHGLIFERFLNPARTNMPDIDLDFQDDKRAEIMQYCANRYGDDHVAQIITFGTMGARNAIRDVGRVMDIPLGEVDQIAKLVPNIPSRPISIPDAIQQVQALKDLYESQSYLRELLDAAAGMEGVARNAGTHAAGVVISDLPVVDYVPLHRPTNNSEDVPIKSVTQYEMSILDHLGLLKVDFLGLGTLTVMQKASDLIFARHNERYTLDNIPLDDAETYEFLSKGYTFGVFQLEGMGMTRFLLQMKPTMLEHIISMVALYRPGPMEIIPHYIARMHGQEEVTYRHPLLEPIMGETFGFAIYQEQVMQAAMELAGYTAAEADMLRKVISKKKEAELELHHDKFVAGAVERGIDQQVADEIFNDWEGFAHYGFNKSHAADYGVIAVQTAYLKAHYTIEYMTALLSQVKNDSKKVALYVADCRSMKIEVLAPDVNSSGWDFEIERLTDGQEVIRFGLGAVKNVGQNPVDIICEARQAAPFQDINDFVRRVDLRKVGRRALESLVRVGALDPFADRRTLLNGLEKIMAVSESHFKAHEAGQMSIFGFVEGLEEEVHLLQAAPMDSREKLEWEKELLGIYLSSHPLSEYLEAMRSKITHYTGQLVEATHKSSVVVAGTVDQIRTIVTKRGAEMAFGVLEDLQGSVELVIFPAAWSKSADVITHGDVVLVEGKLDMEDSSKEPKVLVDRITRIQLSESESAPDQTVKPIPAPPQNYEEDPFMHDEVFGIVDFPVAQPIASASPETHDHSERAKRDKNPSFPVPAETSAITAAPPGISPAGDPLAPASEPLFTETTQKGDPVDINEVREKKNPPPDEAACTKETRLLLLQLATCGSRERDNRRIRQVYSFLTSTPGSDRFAFLCSENGRSYRLEFPNDYTSINESLLRELNGIVGEANISVEGG